MAYYGSYGNVLNLPETRPSMLLDFANTKSLDPRIDFTRASTGTYYDGKTVEKAEENLFTYSQATNAAIWSFQNLPSPSFTELAPDGTNTATLLTLGNFTDGRPSISRTLAGQPIVIVGNVYTVSLFAKAGNYGYIQIMPYLSFSTNQSYANFDLFQGIVSFEGDDAYASITPLNDGWYRCSLTFTATATTETDWQFNIVSGPQSPRNETWTNNGGETLYIWGAQLEQRDRATTYTPTTTQPITNYISVLQTAEQDTARFDHDPVTGESLGLLIEEQRTNLADYSEDFIKNVWVEDGARVLQNAGIAPDGTHTANLFVENEGLGYHRIQKNLGSTLNLYTASIYVKAYTKSVFSLRIGRAGVTTEGAVFDLANGTIISQGTDIQEAKIVPVGNNWYRVHVTNQTTINGTQYFVLGVGDNTSRFTGDGYSGLYIWGAQLEVGAFPTSYIPTPLTYSGRSSTATYRAPDGLIRIAEPNEPRYEINFGGGSNLLLEGAETNLLSYSENFANTEWLRVRSNVVSNTVVAPDGTLTGHAIISNGVANAAYINQVVSGLADNTTYTFSCFVKKGDNNLFQLRVKRKDDTEDGRLFNLETGLAFLSSSDNGIVEIGNGWYRVWFTINILSGATTPRFFLWDVAGDGVINTGIYIWGAQLEAGSTLTSYIPSVETFTGRSSVGTFYDSTGIVRTAASDQPRYTYNPSNLNAPPTLLLEPAATNFVLQSEQIDQSPWARSNSSITANATTAPNGTSTAEKQIPNNGINLGTGISQTAIRNDAFAKTAGTAYTASIFAKASEFDSFMIGIIDTGNNRTVKYNLITGQYTIIAGTGITASMSYINNGWWRCVLTWIQGTGAITDTRWTVADSTATAGNGTSGGFMWGAQIEEGYVPSSYIKTEATQVTRAADTSTSVSGTRAADVYSSSQVTRSSDNASISGENFSSWFNQQTGTIHTEFETKNYNQSTRDQYIFGFRNSALTGIRMPTRIGNEGITQGTIRSFAFTNSFVYAVDHGVYSGGIGKSTFTYNKINDFQTSFAGTLSAQDVTGSLGGYTFNQAMLGIDPNIGDRYLNGYLRKIAYYPVRLPNDTLVEITR